MLFERRTTSIFSRIIHHIRMIRELIFAKYEVVYLRKDNKNIGHLVVSRGGTRIAMSTKKDIVIGPIWIVPNERGKGIASTAIYHILHSLNYMFTYAYEYIEDNNFASIRTVEKNGYTFVGYGKEYGLLKTIRQSERGDLIIYRYGELSIMRFLYVTTIGSTMSFFISLIEELIKQGHNVDIAANEAIKAVPKRYEEIGCRLYHISCSRSPADIHNIQAVREISNLIKKNKYDIVHCHTPIAGAIAYIACRKFRKDGLRVIYTAHGFHFYNGAPLKNWLLYYPIEKFCSRYTDVLITINHEDYERAKKKMKAKRVEYVPGVGIDVDKFADARIGKHCIINSSAVVEHDNVIEDYVHISPGAKLSGNVVVGERTWIGTGANIINNVKICEDVIIGVGSVVIRSVGSPGVYYGVVGKHS